MLEKYNIYKFLYEWGISYTEFLKQPAIIIEEMFEYFHYYNSGEQDGQKSMQARDETKRQMQAARKR